MLCRCPWTSSYSREIRLHTSCVRSLVKKKQVIFLLSTICKTSYFHDSIYMHNYEKNHTKTNRSSFIHICKTWKLKLQIYNFSTQVLNCSSFQECYRNTHTCLAYWEWICINEWGCPIHRTHPHPHSLALSMYAHLALPLSHSHILIALISYS
jgi:hypothetical protein